MKSKRVFCDVGAEFLYSIYKEFVLRSVILFYNQINKFKERVIVNELILYLNNKV
jgi:hypothetical protein